MKRHEKMREAWEEVLPKVREGGREGGREGSEGKRLLLTLHFSLTFCFSEMSFLLISLPLFLFQSGERGRCDAGVGPEAD